MISTLGTTGTCAFDKLDELGPICKEYNMWLHVDAAYAGKSILVRYYLCSSCVRIFLLK